MKNEVLRNLVNNPIICLCIENEELGQGLQAINSLFTTKFQAPNYNPLTQVVDDHTHIHQGNCHSLIEKKDRHTDQVHNTESYMYLFITYTFRVLKLLPMFLVQSIGALQQEPSM